MSGVPDLSVFPVEVHQLSVSKGKLSSEQQEWSSSLNQEITIKEEPEELWSNQEGGRLQGPDEEDIIKFTFVPVPVKSEDDEDNEPQSSDLHQRKPAEMETAADGENCSGPEAARHFDPERDLQPEIEVKIEDSSEVGTDDSADWWESSEHQSGLSSVENIQTRERLTDKNSHCCTECGKSFDYRSHLMHHMRSHTGERPFSCPECGKGCKYKSHLIYHMRTHTGEKPFSCSQCDKKFHVKDALTRHMSKHTGEKPFSCSVCDQRFTHKCNLTQHIRIHTGEKPFSCPACGKRFNKQGHMTRHMRIHLEEKPFSCTECGKRFSQKNNLTEHVRIHTGEKPFSCSDCGKRFSQSRSLSRHVLVHSGEKPFSSAVVKESD